LGNLSWAQREKQSKNQTAPKKIITKCTLKSGHIQSYAIYVQSRKLDKIELDRVLGVDVFQISVCISRPWGVAKNSYTCALGIRFV
jgi:hypothetical protein